MSSLIQRRRLIRAPARQARTLAVLRRLNLTTGLRLCLDAGDEYSYLSGQSWLDRSSGAHDFFLGADVDATITDPTFTGNPGSRSKETYFAHDGGDYFTYDTTNETWMNSLHKDNAVFTLLMWAYLTSVTSVRMAGMASASTSTGIMWGTSVGGLLNQSIFTGSGTAGAFNGAAVPLNSWALLGWSHNEAVGASGAISFVSGVPTFATSTYTTPSASDGTSTMKIGGRGDGANNVPSGSRIAMFSAWDVALTSAQLAAYFQATRGRFGV